MNLLLTYLVRRDLLSLGISNWKKFLKTYNSDDTEQIVFAFADRNWKYKKIVFSKSSVS